MNSIPNSVQQISKHSPAAIEPDLFMVTIFHIVYSQLGCLRGRGVFLKSIAE